VYRFSAIAELLQMIWHRKAWVLLPPVLALILVAGLMIAAQATPLGPLIYPIF
jgi:cytochrome c oxidase subunit IV